MKSTIEVELEPFQTPNFVRAVSHPLVLVEWEDAFGVPAGWEFEDEAPRATSRVRSVGYLIESDADGLMLVPHIGTPTAGRRQFAGHRCIPARQVVSVSSLALVPASSDPAPTTCASTASSATTT